MILLNPQIVQVWVLHRNCHEVVLEALLEVFWDETVDLLPQR